MNLAELRNSVLKLTFSDELESENAFLFAVNRAVMRSRINFPKIKTKKIAQYPIRNLLGDNLFKVISVSEPTEFYGNDLTSYYFEGYGIGNMTVYYFNPSPSVNGFEELFTVEINSVAEFKKYRGFIKRFNAFQLGKFKVKFSGDFLFTVKNLALYDRLTSSAVADIPDFCEYVAYDLNEFTKEVGVERGVMSLRKTFIDLVKPPKIIDKKAREEIDYKYDGGILELPRNLCGEIEIVYSALPETVGTSSSETDKVDFPDVLADVAAYLVASNLILEEDEQLSNYYLNLFKEAENHALNLTKIANLKYSSAYNWS